MRDHSLSTFLNNEERARFDKVQVWVHTCPKSTGIEVLINPKHPIIVAGQREYFTTGEAMKHFIQTVNAAKGQGMYSVCLSSDLPNAQKVLAERGLEVGEVSSIDLPFFSPRDRISMMLIEVRIPQETEARERFETAWIKGALAASAYREQIVALNAPSELHAGEKIEIGFKLKNLGTAAWPAVGTKDFRYQVNMGNRWIKDGVRSEDSRATMKADLQPGAETDIQLVVNAPSVPGEYVLEIDMVHEGITWFEERGATPLLIPVRVVP